jgi:cytochrome P450
VTELRPADWFPLPHPGDGDHHAELARRRRDAPVEALAGMPGGEVVVVYRHADVLAVLTDPAFSTDVVEERYGAVLGRSLVTLAPPVRRAVRSALLDALRPDTEVVAAVVDAVVAGRVAALEAALAEGPVDVVPTLAAEVPARVLAVLLGLEEQDWAEVAALASAAARLLEEPRAALRAGRTLRRRLATRLAERRTGDGERQPGRDVVGALAGLEVEGRRLDDAAVVSTLLLLCWAGTETAFPAIATSLHAVLQQPGAAEHARTGPAGPRRRRRGAALGGPGAGHLAAGDREVELAGRRLSAGTVVLAHLGSANRDEEVFRDPDVFDPRRRPSRHLAFGSGPHRCLGWQLARAELAGCLSAVLTRLPGLRLAPGSTPPEGQVVRSPRRVPVELPPRPVGRRAGAAQPGPGPAAGATEERQQ